MLVLRMVGKGGVKGRKAEREAVRGDGRKWGVKESNERIGEGLERRPHPQRGEDKLGSTCSFCLEQTHSFTHSQKSVTCTEMNQLPLIDPP